MRINKKLNVLKYGLVAGLIGVFGAGLSVSVRADAGNLQKSRSFQPSDRIDDQLAVKSDTIEEHLAVRMPPDSDLGDKLAEDLFRSGTDAYFEGDYGSALKRFEKAAEDGHPLAQWKLGRMYQEGDGVGENAAMAFKYFTDLAIGRGDEPPNTSMAPFVAYSLVAVGNYYLVGIKDAKIRENPEKAMKIFRYAASFYGNAEAQFNLGRMYFDGSGGILDKMLAARWLKLAALKGHPESQALLGRMMFLGDGILARPSEGLMWLTLARERAEGREDDWIRDDQERAFALATETERRSAITGVGKWNSAFNANVSN